MYCLQVLMIIAEFLDFLYTEKGALTLEQRKHFAKRAFHVSSHYDTAIFNYFNEEDTYYKASFENR